MMCMVRMLLTNVPSKSGLKDSIAEEISMWKTKKNEVAGQKRSTMMKSYVSY
ncbi:hypothetical protein WH47_01427 [Habropoda laboriosa]|uniref:Uncharacterized protein n=1 Tax=Habropoda laboriosa TaxID=597456 RepID=A0A0L7QJV4_9HYME|nr:hypothetical protein WH47_01427 [Habropoda laboriosa]